MTRRNFNEFQMYNNTYIAVRTRYPLSSGFEIKTQDRRKKGYRPDFLIQKHIRYGQTSYYYKVIVEVKAVPYITSKHISQINWYAKNHSGKHSFIMAKYLVIPTYSNITGVKKLIDNSNIKIIRLKGFKI